MKAVIATIIVVVFLGFSLVWMYLMTQGMIPESIGLGIGVDPTILMLILVAAIVLLGVLLVKGKNKSKKG